MSSETVEDNGNSIPTTAAGGDAGMARDSAAIMTGIFDAVIKKVLVYFPKPEIYDEAHQDIIYDMQTNFNSAYRLLIAYDQTTGVKMERRTFHSILLAAMLYSACKADAGLGLKRDLATIITSITDEYLLDFENVKKMIEYDSCNDGDDVNIEYIPVYLHSMNNFNTNYFNLIDNERITYFKQHKKVLDKVKKFNQVSWNSVSRRQYEKIMRELEGGPAPSFVTDGGGESASIF
jgi:hypothetical protein